MVVAQNHAKKLNPTDYNPGAKPPQKQEQPKRRRFYLPRGQRLVFTGLVLAAFITGTLITYYYAQIFSMGYKMYCLEKELSDIESDSESLDVEIDKLNSLDRIEVVAVKKLGMVKPGGNIVTVNTDLNKDYSLSGTQSTEQTAAEKSGRGSESSKKEENSVPAEKRNWVLQAFTQLTSHLTPK